MSVLLTPTLGLYAAATTAAAVSHAPAELAALGGCGSVLLLRSALRRRLPGSASSDVESPSERDAGPVGEVQV